MEGPTLKPRTADEILGYHGSITVQLLQDLVIPTHVPTKKMSLKEGEFIVLRRPLGAESAPLICSQGPANFPEEAFLAREVPAGDTRDFEAVTIALQAKLSLERQDLLYILTCMRAGPEGIRLAHLYASDADSEYRSRLFEEKSLRREAASAFFKKFGRGDTTLYYTDDAPDPNQEYPIEIDGRSITCVIGKWDFGLRSLRAHWVIDDPRMVRFKQKPEKMWIHVEWKLFEKGETCSGEANQEALDDLKSKSEAHLLTLIMNKLIQKQVLPPNPRRPRRSRR